MANLNKVMLMGNITRDPELKYMPNQTAVCDFGLAINRSWTGQDGVKKEETTFVDCSCFGKTAEILAKYKKKGDPLFVDGRLKLDQWEAQDGTKRSKMRVIVENFQFLNRSAGGMGGNNANSDAAMPEYGGEPTSPPRQQPNRAPAARPFAAGGRPNAGPAQRPAAAPNYDSPDSIPEDDGPPLKDEDIPF